MKPELSEKQLDRLNQAYNDAYYPVGGTESDGTKAVIEAWERIRPKDAAPVMWRRCEANSPSARIFRQNDSIFNAKPVGDAYFLTCGDLLDLPIPADPTPEEKAEAEFEAEWETRTFGEDDKDKCRLFFMAAKFPAGKEGE